MELSVKIKALVEGAKEVEKLAKEVDGLTKQAQGTGQIPDPTTQLRKGAQETTGILRDLQQQIVGFFALGQIKSFVGDVIAETRRAEGAFRGLEAVAKYSGISMGTAYQEASRLAADGLIDVASASKALQNLLQRGYNLDQAVTTIERLKDAAAFNRQSHLSMAEAVATATEGLRNENSILVDNAGVTKNVSVMWKEYAAAQGITVEQMTQAQKIQAEYNGIIGETEAQVGNARKASEGWQGATARLNAQLTDFKVLVGDALTPVLGDLATMGSWLVQNVFTPLLGLARSLGPVLGFVVDTTGILLTDLANAPRRIGEARRAMLDTLRQIAVDSGTPSFAKERGGKDDPARQAELQEKLSRKIGKDKDKKEKDTTSARLALAREAAEAESSILRDELQRQTRDLEYALQQRWVAYDTFQRRKAALEQAAIDASIGAKRTELESLRKVEGTGKDEADRINAKARAKALEAEIVVLVRQRADAEVTAAREAAAMQRDLNEALAKARIELSDLKGTTTPEQRRGAIEAEMRELIQKVRSNRDDAGQSLISELIGVKAAAQDLAALEAVFNAALGRMANAQQAVFIRQQAGAITEGQAREELRALYASTAAEVEGLIPKMEDLARSTANPEAINRVGALKNRVVELKTQVNDTAMQIRGGLQNSFADLAFDFMSRTKSMREAFEDFGKSVIQMMQRIIAQKFAERLVGDLFGSGLGASVVDGAGKAIAGTKHTGGIVGALGPMRSVSPLAFLRAPRLHTGGVLGLAPGEVPIIAKAGEEVLTADDPRHSANGGKGITVNVYEAPGTKATVREGTSDSGAPTVDVLIEQVEQGIARNVSRGAGAMTAALERTFGLNRAAGGVR